MYVCMFVCVHTSLHIVPSNPCPLIFSQFTFFIFGREESSIPPTGGIGGGGGGGGAGIPPVWGVGGGGGGGGTRDLSGVAILVASVRTLQDMIRRITSIVLTW